MSRRSGDPKSTPGGWPLLDGFDRPAEPVDRCLQSSPVSSEPAGPSLRNFVTMLLGALVLGLTWSPGRRPVEQVQDLLLVIGMGFGLGLLVLLVLLHRDFSRTVTGGMCWWPAPRIRSSSRCPGFRNFVLWVRACTAVGGQARQLASRGAAAPRRAHPAGTPNHADRRERRAIDYDRCARADIVGVTGMLVQRHRMRDILTELKRRNVYTVVGGRGSPSRRTISERLRT